MYHHPNLLDLKINCFQYSKKLRKRPKGFFFLSQETKNLNACCEADYSGSWLEIFYWVSRIKQSVEFTTQTWVNLGWVHIDSSNFWILSQPSSCWFRREANPTSVARSSLVPTRNISHLQIVEPLFVCIHFCVDQDYEYWRTKT